MYCRNIKRYQYLSSETESKSGGYIMVMVVITAIIINVYFGVTSTAEHLDSITTTQAQNHVQMASLSFRN